MAAATGWRIIPVILGCLILPSAAHTQVVSKERISRVSLADASGGPGSRVEVPISFVPGEGVALGRLKLKITYRSVDLLFERIERAPAIDWEKVDVYLEDHKVSENDRSEYTTLTVVATLRSAAPDQDGLPRGILGSLRFRIRDDADGAIIGLIVRAEATAVRTGTSLPPSRVRERDGAIIVVAPGWDRF